jgi:hypothetical protein
MKEEKIWITINSTLAFMSAFVVAKMTIGLARFVVMRHFDGSVIMRGYEILCVSWKYSPIWTYKSVISIYLTGFITALVLYILSNILYHKYKRNRGFLKLWLIWLIIIFINQSIGLFLRDIPFKRDLFHALQWMHLPYAIMIIFTIISIPLLIMTNLYNHAKFLRMTPTYDYILSKKRQRNFYALIAVIPAILGSFFLLAFNGFKFQSFQVIELFILIVSLGFSFILMLKGELTREIRIVKDEPSNRFSLLLFVGSIIIFTTFYFFSTIYF